MRTVLIAPFDPVTDREIAWARAYQKEHGLAWLYLMPWGEGVLDRKQRFSLLLTALQPYRHLAAADSIGRDDTVVQCEGTEDEEKVRQGEFRLCSKAVRNSMNDKGCYYDEVARFHCNPHRYTHSLGVADTAAKLARAHHMDELQAYKAGLLHDVTKAMSDEEGRKIIASGKPEWLSLSPKVWHSYTAVVFCEQSLDLHDKAILHAIEHHTIGDGTSDLDHILYIADKIEPGRGYDTSKEMALSLKDLKAGAALIREESKKYIYEKEGVHV